MSPSIGRIVILFLVAFVISLQIYNLFQIMQPNNNQYYESEQSTFHQPNIGNIITSSSRGVQNELVQDGLMNDEARHWDALIRAASAANYTCDGKHVLPTSLSQTVAINTTISTSPLDGLHTNYQFISIQFTFRAYNIEGNPQHTGGDVFIVDYQSYTPPSVEMKMIPGPSLVKSSTFVTDNLDGTYSAVLHLLPNIDSTVEISLRHYASCHEGLLLPKQVKAVANKPYNIRRQYVSQWDEAGKEIQSYLSKAVAQQTNKSGKVVEYSSFPKCSQSANKGDIFNGVWYEFHHNGNLTNRAGWMPFNCTLDVPADTDGEHYRIGDSTMPGRTIEVGIPFAPYIKGRDYIRHQSRFTGMLLEQLHRYTNETFTSKDTIVYGGGLHHLFHGQFNVPTTAKLVIRGLCQLALTFPGVMILKGPNPIQQHLYHVVDQTSLNARRINFELKHWLELNGNKLGSLCNSIPLEELASFIALADDEGNLMQNDKALPILLQKYDYSWERDSSFDLRNLVAWMQSLSNDERSRRYGNRTVDWVDMESVLLPRPELYRDKIHDTFWLSVGHHSHLLAIAERDSNKYFATMLEIQHGPKRSAKEQQDLVEYFSKGQAMGGGKG